MTTNSTGDIKLDKLLVEYGNAMFDCGEWNEPGDCPTYDDDRKYLTYQEASDVCAKARDALYLYLRTAHSAGEPRG
jgi:hypothetical protein